VSALTRDSPRIIRQRILSFSAGQDGIGCVLANHSKVLLPRLLASHAAIGDEIIFPIPDREVIGAEVYLTKAPSLPLSNCFYLAPIGYATQPQLDKRDQTFVSARVQQDLLGISSIVLPCDTLREYFYGIDDSKSGSVSSTLYQLLRVATAASPAEIRVAYKLRTLELKSTGAAQAKGKNWGAFNILGHPGLRACYDALLRERETPAVFPYGGFGSLLVPAPATGKHSSCGAWWFSCQYRRSGDFICLFATVSFTRIERWAVTCAARLNSGLTPPSCTLPGTQAGTGGSIR